MKRLLISRHLKNSKGQVALFVALIFQVLFVFFAMIVNVGLLVHHKINLQNSVDLAAYYGAMKQAEMLNAIGHVNYQIRQSFKLLTFRYQQLGSAGTVASGRHPYMMTGSATGVVTREDDSKVLPYDTAFCIPYAPFDLVNQNESYCKTDQTMVVPLPGVPSFGASNQWSGFQANVIQLATVLQQQAQNYCAKTMGMNWLQLARFIVAYKMDIRNRKKLLLGLASELSKNEPRDIQGDSIKDGVYRTLLKNLTLPNRESLSSNAGGAKFEFVNSFSVGSCGNGGNTNGLLPPGWLKEMFIFPIYAVFDAVCDSSTTANNIQFKPKYFNVGAQPSVSQNVQPQYASQAADLAQLATEMPGNSGNPDQLLYRTSAGFEKDPWCVGYVGVSATTIPKIPFSPFGSVTLKATAFAKPFGGRIGPWYGTVWPGGADQSDPAVQTDAVMPMRVKEDIQIGTVDPAQLRLNNKIFPNHSRYMGDKAGVMSELTMGYFAKAIHEKLGLIKLAWFDQITDQGYDQKNANGDPLAWDKDLNQAPPIRNLEISAIAPDQFDTANYSIDPDFYNNYVKKIEKGYGSQFQFLIRSDLGSRMQGSDKEKKFSIRNQIEASADPAKSLIETQSKLTYYLNQFGQLLTSWQQRSPDEYVLDVDRFGKCLVPVKDDEDEKFQTIGACKAGGRVGYSVKLVDGKFLKNEVKGQSNVPYSLGGQGTSGIIKNPAPTF
jgi:hypothetical protein